MTKQEIIVKYGLSFIGVPYKWGGSNPISGFDCSGLIQELLMAVAMDLPGDQNAQAFYNHFKIHGKLGLLGPGALCFYGNAADGISHITMMIDEKHCIGANGGGSQTIDLKSADAKDAFVKIRPFDYRKDLIAVIMPNY